MWVTFIASAFAAAISLSMVNLATQLNSTVINKDRSAHNPPTIERTLNNPKIS